MTNAIYISKYVQSRLSNPKPQPLTKYEKKAERGSHILSKIFEIATKTNNNERQNCRTIKS